MRCCAVKEPGSDGSPLPTAISEADVPVTVKDTLTVLAGTTWPTASTTSTVTKAKSFLSWRICVRSALNDSATGVPTETSEDELED